MLAAIGCLGLDDLFDQIPAAVRLRGALDIPDGRLRDGADRRHAGLAARNRHADDLVCFAGAGAYDHYVPSVVWALAGRSEFYTAYTPYQPELSQGVLQALFEYQSMICELTGLEVSNASLYDGPTALVEAVHMTFTPERRRVLVSSALDPRYRETLETFGRGAGYRPKRSTAPPMSPATWCSGTTMPTTPSTLRCGGNVSCWRLRWRTALHHHLRQEHAISSMTSTTSDLMLAAIFFLLLVLIFTSVAEMGLSRITGTAASRR